MKSLVAALLCMFWVGSVEAGVIHMTKVGIQNTAKKVNEETHTWYLEKREFRLNIKGNGRVVDYIWTGRSLLACLKITDKNTISTVSIHKDLQKALESGLCIVAPIDVMTSFYISPLHSLSFTQTNDSMKSTLLFQKYSEKRKGASKLREISCNKISRSFKFSIGESGGAEISGDSTLCYAKDNWRKAMWRELNRRLLQQKSGKELRKKLKKYKFESIGTLIDGEVEVSQKADAKSPLNTSKLKVTLLKSSESKISKKYFKRPSQYQMIETFQSSDRVIAKLNVSKGKSDEVNFGSILKMFSMPFLGL